MTGHGDEVPQQDPSESFWNLSAFPETEQAALQAFDPAEVRAIGALLDRALGFRSAGRAQLCKRAQARGERLQARYIASTRAAFALLAQMEEMGLEGVASLRERVPVAPVQVARQAQRRLGTSRLRLAVSRGRLERSVAHAAAHADAETEALVRRARVLLAQTPPPGFLLMAHQLATALSLGSMRAAQRGAVSRVSLKEMHKVRPKDAGPYNPTALVCSALEQIDVASPLAAEGILAWASDLRELTRLLEHASYG